jgi:hypothetical protein
MPRTTGTCGLVGAPVESVARNPFADSAVAIIPNVIPTAPAAADPGMFFSCYTPSQRYHHFQIDRIWCTE